MPNDVDVAREEAPSRRPITGRTRTLVILVDKGVYHFTGHWIAFVHLILLIYLAPSVVAPYLMSAGHTGAARILYTIYRPTCHQLPERSFFLFGQQTVYSYVELTEAGMDPSLSPIQRRFVYGSPDLGYKMVNCQRDIAIYGGIVLFGILYAVAGRRWLRPLPFWGFLLFILPVAIDGITQGLGLRESTPWLRTMSGLLAAAGSVWFGYPYIEAAMLDLRRDVARKLGRPR